MSGLVDKMAASTANRKSRDETDGKPFKSSGRFFDRKLQRYIVKVLPGAFYISDDPSELLVTVLGSCVSACIRDTKAQVGGMNHFMLANHGGKNSGSQKLDLRYGHYAMEILINNIMKRGCGRRDVLEVKVFGGGKMYESNNAIGEQNAKFVIDYLNREGLKIVSQDLCDNHARRIQFEPTTGRVMRRFVSDTNVSQIIKTERDYDRQVHKKDDTGDVELFTD